MDPICPRGLRSEAVPCWAFGVAADTNCFSEEFALSSEDTEDSFLGTSRFGSGYGLEITYNPSITRQSFFSLCDDASFDPNQTSDVERTSYRNALPMPKPDFKISTLR